MTEGISKVYLEGKLLQAKKYNDIHIIYILRYLITECTELDPWIPIDENTPKDKELLLSCSGQQFIGEWCDQHVRWEDNCGCEIYPTHFKQLQENTK